MVNAMSYLIHYGIRGQKWGKRNGPPYPLDPEDRSEKEKDLNQKGIKYRKDGGVTIKKGSVINRVTNYDESEKKGHAYVTYLEHDSEQYKGMFSAKIHGCPYQGFKDVYQVTFTATKDLKSPGEKERMETFEAMYKTDKKFRKKLDEYAKSDSNRIKKDVSDIDFTNLSDRQISSIGYTIFTRSLGSKDSYVRDKYFNTLALKGYDFVSDDLDKKNGFGRAPAIIFDTQKSLNYEGQRKLSNNEIYSTFFKRGAKMKDA